MPTAISGNACAFLVVTLALIMGCSYTTTAPADPAPGPQQQPEIGGATFVLERVGQSGPPFLTSDRTYAGDGTRTRFWIRADTIRFGTDGSVFRRTAHTQLDETPGAEPASMEWMASRSGVYRAFADRITLAWTLGVLPVPVAGGDTLSISVNALVRRVRSVNSCGNCDDVPFVEYVYVRK